MFDRTIRTWYDIALGIVAVGWLSLLITRSFICATVGKGLVCNDSQPVHEVALIAIALFGVAFYFVRRSIACHDLALANAGWSERQIWMFRRVHTVAILAS